MKTFVYLKHEYSSKLMWQALVPFFDFCGKHNTPELEEIAKRIKAGTDIIQKTLGELDGLVADERAQFEGFSINGLQVAAHNKTGELQAEISRAIIEHKSACDRHAERITMCHKAGLSDKEISGLPDATPPDEEAHRAKLEHLRGQLAICEGFVTAKNDFDLDALATVLDFDECLLPPLKVEATHIPTPTQWRQSM
jgi:hypothetical protein